jgi:hypothetical protein
MTELKRKEILENENFGLKHIVGALALGDQIPRRSSKRGFERCHAEWVLCMDVGASCLYELSRQVFSVPPLARILFLALYVVLFDGASSLGNRTVLGEFEGKKWVG